MTVPTTHPFAAHLERVAAAEPHAAWTPEDGALPALYLSHGAPPLFEDAGWMTQLFTWARSMPRPKAVLIVSAHWEAAPLSLSSTDAAVTPVYDFGGFDPMYFRMRYDTPDAAAFGARVLGALGGGEPVHQQQSRGLDHGAWVPLKVMYPEADIPVLQLSLPTSDPDRLLRLGARLRGLREEGVLVVGSGLHHPRPALPHPVGLPRAHAAGLVDGVRPLGRRAARPRRRRRARRLPAPGAGHALRPPDRRALHPAVRHAGRRDRPRGAPGLRPSTASGWACRSAPCRSPDRRSAGVARSRAMAPAASASAAPQTGSRSRE